MAPPALRFVFIGRVLRIQDENVCIPSIVAQNGIQGVVAGLEVAGVYQTRCSFQCDNQSRLGDGSWEMGEYGIPGNERVQANAFEVALRR